MRIPQASQAGDQGRAAKSQVKVQKTGRFSKLLDEKRKELPAQLAGLTESPHKSAFDACTSQTGDVASVPINVERLANEIVDHVPFSQVNNAQRIEIQFNAQTLSGLQVAIRSQKGIISVSFLTPVTRVAELLRNNVGNLRSALESRGVRVSHLRVNRPTP